MVAKNDITGDELKSGLASESYTSGWDLIWGDNSVLDAEEPEEEYVKEAE
jgi:hypothetical protein